MQATRIIKSVDKGQIVVPKDIRDKLGLSENFWMQIFIDDGKIVVQPVQANQSKEGYLESLLSINTDWFSEDDKEDYQKVREEIEEHVSKNSL